MSRGETEITDVPLKGQERDAGHSEPWNRDGSGNSHAAPEQSKAAAERRGEAEPPGPIRALESATEESPDSDRASLGKSDHPLTNDVSTNENCHPVPQHTSTPNHTLRTEAGGHENPAADLQNDHTPPTGLANGAPPICTPPTASGGPPGWRLPQPPKCNGKVCHDKKRPLSTASHDQKRLKTTAAQIQQAAGDDCCVHCVLACLFCELLSLCSVLGQCMACGQGCEALCCCGGGATGGVVCGEEACSAVLDCGILEDCCGSSDCMEICLDCCSICFPV